MSFCKSLDTLKIPYLGELSLPARGATRIPPTAEVSVNHMYVCACVCAWSDPQLLSLRPQKPVVAFTRPVHFSLVSLTVWPFSIKLDRFYCCIAWRYFYRYLYEGRGGSTKVSTVSGLGT